MKMNNKRIFGAIIVLCAIGIVILNIIAHKSFDDYLIAIILLCASVPLLLSKPKESETKPAMNRRTKYMVVTSLSIAIVSGLVVFATTIF